MCSPRADASAGFTLIEALILLVVFGLVAQLVLGTTATGVRANTRLVEDAQQSVADLGATAAFDALLRGAKLLHGDARALRIEPGGQDSAGCHVRDDAIDFEIERFPVGGGVACGTSGRRRSMLHWSEGAARFEYSGDGSTWSTVAPRDSGTVDQPDHLIVRLVLATRRGERLIAAAPVEAAR